MNTLVPNCRTIFGKASAKISPLKKKNLTCGHPDAFTAATIATAKNTIVLTTAIATPRTPSPWSGARIRE